MSATSSVLRSTSDDNSDFAAMLRFVGGQLDAAVFVRERDARDAMALAIIDAVSQFVLGWQEGGSSVGENVQGVGRTLPLREPVTRS